MTAAAASHAVPAGDGVARNPLFSALIGLTALLVLLQSVWAGIFLQHDGERDAASGWIQLHAITAYVAILLALAATVVALRALRARRDLWVGSAVLTGLLVVETALGGLVDGGHDALTAVHIPLAMVAMGLVVWLPLRARSRA